MTDPDRVAAQCVLQSRIDRRGAKQPLLDSFGLKNTDRLVDDGCRHERDRLELDLSGLKLRNIENIVEQVQQAVAGFVNRIHDMALLAVELGIEQGR